MSCSQLCHQPAVILTWMHLQVKSLVQVVLKTLKLELGLKMISEGMSCDCHGNEVLFVVLVPGELWKGYWGMDCWLMWLPTSVWWAGSSLNGSGCTTLCHHPRLAARGFEFSAEIQNHQFVRPHNHSVAPCQSSVSSQCCV